MATEERHASALIDRVLNRTTQFDFFQVVRLLELTTTLYPDEVDSSPTTDPSRRDTILFGSDKSLGFNGQAISSVEWNQGQQRFQVTSTPLALIGATGVLPDYFTQEVTSRSRNNDQALQALLDLFHQRVQQLLFRTLGKHQTTYDFETRRRFTRDDSDTLGHCLQRLVGLAHTPQQWRDLKLHNLVFYASLFLHGNRSANGMEALIKEYFSAPTEVRQFQGQWLQLSTTDQSRISAQPGRSRYARLGVDFTLGTRVWDLRSSCRIVLGPLTRQQFQELMPGQPTHLQLGELTRLYGGSALEFSLQPELAQTEMAPWQLATNGSWGRLGWSTWLHSETPQKQPTSAPIIPLN